MLNAFFEDQSGFKKSIFLCLILSVLLLFAADIMINQFQKRTVENQKLSSMYSAQENWLKEFDREAAQKLEEKILKPITEKDLDSVQSMQLTILKNAGVNIISVRQDNTKTASRTNLRFQKFNVQLESSWEKICKALNEFERKNLVVITALDMSPSGEIIKTTMEYNIYYL